jgi:hypothetical protein
MTTAKTIMSQIKMIDAYAFMAWGAKEFVDTGSGLQFKVGGLAKFKGYVHITLNSLDLYDIHFFKIRSGVMKTVSQSSNIFVEDLVNTIDLVVQ